MAARRRGGAGQGGQRVVRPHGQLRKSQIVGAAGPGALLDLPRHAVIVSGLEHWGNPWLEGFPQVDDERTETRLSRSLELDALSLFSPPVEGDTFGSTLQKGIKVFQFPQWFIAQHELEKGVRPLVHVKTLQNGRWLDDRQKKHRVVPVRFVRACANGHIQDINWSFFAHRGSSDCRRQLRWQERGASGDFVDIFVVCECGRFPPRAIIEATKNHEGTPALGWCNGAMPWLGSGVSETCEGENGAALPMKLLVRNASNAYFGIVDRSITIPEPDQSLRSAVFKVKEFLLMVEELTDVRKARRVPQVQAALGRFTDEQVWAELQRRKNLKATDTRAPKVAELDTFLAVRGQEGADTPESVFFAREQSLPSPRPPLLQPLDKVLRVERLREVSVQVGFTRFEAPSTDLDGELDLRPGMAAMARELKWLPAVENRGEGLFFSFDAERVKAWSKRKAVQERKAQLAAGFQAWALARKLKKAVEKPVEYVMLHSLSHLLLTQLSLECGYAASSIRERVYVGEKGCGILLHTGSPDAEGTLGGLANAVRDDRRLENLFRGVLELAAFCSNDPICSAHRPDDVHEERFLHGAACHGCLLLPETSCEARNDFLDRALVVETLSTPGCAFLSDE
ncbi:MAG: DrmB family protein [Myxococcota bacterium]